MLECDNEQYTHVHVSDQQSTGWTQSQAFTNDYMLLRVFLISFLHLQDKSIGQKYCSVAEYLPPIHEALGLITSTAKTS